MAASTQPVVMPSAGLRKTVGSLLQNRRSALLVERVRERDAGASEHLKEGPQVAQVEWTTPTLTEVAYIEELRQLYRCDDGDDRTIDRDIDRPPSSVWRFDHFQPLAAIAQAIAASGRADVLVRFIQPCGLAAPPHRRGGRHRGVVAAAAATTGTTHSRLRRRQQLL